MLTLAQAQAITDAAIDDAAARGCTPLAVVVTDPGGAIRAGLRSEDQAPCHFDIAHAKARSALGFGISTAKLAGFFGSNPVSTIGITGATGGRFLPVAGGVVITDAEGRTLGAAGVVSGPAQDDDQLVRRAVQAAGLQASP